MILETKFLTFEGKWLYFYGLLQILQIPPSVLRNLQLEVDEMAERTTIAAQPRTVVGKQVNRLRRDGWIPAVVYGQNAPLHIQLENLTLRRVLREVGTTHLLDIDVAGNPRTVLVREIQKHVTRGDLLHVDFLEVNMSSTVTLEANLVLVGKIPADLAAYGAIELAIRSVELECLPDALVSEIQVNASQIQSADDTIFVKDLEAPAGVKILDDPETVVASFVRTATEEETDAGLTSTEVEVIKKGKKEEENF